MEFCFYFGLERKRKFIDNNSMEIQLPNSMELACMFKQLPAFKTTNDLFHPYKDALTQIFKINI